MNNIISIAASLFGMSVGLATMAFLSAPPFGNIPDMWLVALAIGRIGGFFLSAGILRA